MKESRFTPGAPLPPGNLPYTEALLESFTRDPESVPPEWREYFASVSTDGNGHVRRGPSFRPRSVFSGTSTAPTQPSESRLDPRVAGVSDRLYQLVRNHRVRGHIIAEVDPLGRQRPIPPELKLEFYGFTDSELDLLANLPTLHYGTPLTIREIFHRLRETYCRSIGIQYMHIDDLSVRQWLQNRMESSQNRLHLSRDEQIRILTSLTDAVVFEEFLRRKFLGAKTFSLEGSETLLPLLDLALEKAGHQGVETVVMGMGHRGRLNVLAHIVGKDPRDIFREFADPNPEAFEGRGDVKYHLGHSGDWITADGCKIHVSLCFNPSHLEFVDPVVMGRVRAQQDRLEDRDHRRVLGVLIHGDAAFAGEGVVQESLNFSRLPGYTVGGILHIIVNNQIGFTTPPSEGRSTPYATDVARMLQVPIFHVNGEDPEAVAQVVRLAMDFRAEFQSDVFIDMYGYRRWGHNETDEPTFTQPLLYQAIARQPGVPEGYLQHLLKLQTVTREEADEISRERHSKLEEQLRAAGTAPVIESDFEGIWRGYTGGPEPLDEPDTGVGARPSSGAAMSDSREQPSLSAAASDSDTKVLADLLRKLTDLPPNFHVHPKLKRGLQSRREMADGSRPLDWSAAEALAFATLAVEGVGIRLTGQDTIRGTFSQRHAALFDQQDGFPFVPLQHVAPDQAPVQIVNSPLSEAGALGFEYGYSLDSPDALVLWEAQFGDFVNAAQVIIDQFLAAAEDKWRRLSGLVLLLPHGFEGMGPEHSSARIERFLELAAEDNLQIVQPTTPAQYFHVLRRQALRRWRKPLIVLTPKSLLRHPKCVSPLTDFTIGSFQRVLPDHRSAGFPARSNAKTNEGSGNPAANSNDTKRILICSGKVYHDLAAHRDAQKRYDVAIVRVEQLYPLHAQILEHALADFADNTPTLWVQEEPANMGAWRYLHERFGKHLFGRFPFAPISRFESASPATGSHAAHNLEQARLIARAFGEPEPRELQPHSTAAGSKLVKHDEAEAS